jgi:membrane fusion protein, heavy metal efflux system
MKLDKQKWLIAAIILIGIAVAGLILKTEKPVIDEHGHAEHAEETTDKRPAHGEAGHDHEKDHLAPSANEAAVSEEDHDHAAMATESVKGPHGGKLFTDDDYAVEVTIFEQNQPPQFRLYTYLNGKQLAPKDSAVQLKVSRLGRAAETFKFLPENDYLTSKITVTTKLRRG